VGGGEKGGVDMVVSAGDDPGEKLFMFPSAVLFVFQPGKAEKGEFGEGAEFIDILLWPTFIA